MSCVLVLNGLVFHYSGTSLLFFIYIFPTTLRRTLARNISPEYPFVLCMHTILHESNTLNVDVVQPNDIIRVSKLLYQYYCYCIHMFNRQK